MELTRIKKKIQNTFVMGDTTFLQLLTHYPTESNYPILFWAQA
jgi:hypothetical protein